MCSQDVHHCFIFSNQLVKCFGYNYYQQCGVDYGHGYIGDNEILGDYLPFVDPSNVNGITQIACGETATCALKQSTDTVFCWGRNADYILGSTNTALYQPTAVSGWQGTVTKLVVGGTFACVLTSTQKVYCWGANAQGQLAIGNTAKQSQPQFANFGASVVDVAAASFCTCVVTVDGLVKCVGHPYCNGKDDGQNEYLGSTTSSIGSNLRTLELGSSTGPVEEIYACSRYVFCAVFTSRFAKCWGYASQNILGDGDVTSHNPGKDLNSMGDNLPYLKPAGNSLIKSIGSGGIGVCFVTMDNQAACWGVGTSKAEDLELYSSSWLPPVLYMITVYGPSSEGYPSACALLTTREVQCFGSMFWGSEYGGLDDKPIPGDTLDLGTEAQIGASIGCQQCPNAYYCPGDDTSHACPENHFCPGDGYAHQCDPCMTDYYQLTNCTSTTNTQCQQCTQCLAGTYAAVACGGPNPGQCDPCPADHYCPGDGLMHPCSTECSTY
eukprot:2747351-Rhodomonas_salina.1